MIFQQSKFNRIQFPFYGLKRKPDIVLHSPEGVTVRKHENSTRVYTLWNQETKGKTYLHTLVRLENERLRRIVFDYTCINLSQLIHQKIKWGVDNQHNIFDLSIPQKFKSQVLKAIKIYKNLLWVKGISYPFELHNEIPSVELDLIWLQVVLIDDTWWPLKITYYPERESYVTI